MARTPNNNNFYSGYPLHRSVFQWGPAEIMYNTVRYNTMQCAIRLVSFNAVTPPQLTSAELSETFHSTKLTNDIEASRFKKPAL